MSVQRIERGDLWKNNARSLQLRLRDRFRVAVDRRRRRRPPSSIFSDGHFSSSSSSSTLHRLLSRFRDFRRRHSLHSSSFYRKTVSKDFSAEEDSVLMRMLQSVAVPLLGNACHVFMHGLNRIQVYGVEKLHDALLHRPKNKPLLTVSNHVASVDDPFVIASLLPPRVMLDVQNIRWTLCATDRCFKNSVTSAFFRGVKVLPVARGDGIYQKGMDLAIAKLNSGGWVHIFPEGSRSRDGGKTLGSSKRGVGRLILDADTVPIVIPFVHTGMQEIMPIGSSFPRIGKTVRVLVGEPIQLDDLLNVEDAEDRGKLYDAVATRIGTKLHELKAQVEKLGVEELVQLQDSITSETSVHTEANTKQIQTNEPELTLSDRYFRMISASEAGICSRIRDYLHSTELLSFAARGLFMNHGAIESTANIRESNRAIGPLRAWRQYLDANLRQLNTC